jgi:streptogramin lyase
LDQRAARRTAAELFEFDDYLKYVKRWSPDNYAAPFTHSSAIDKYDNIWRVEEASGLIVKFDPDTVKMVHGRKLG